MTEKTKGLSGFDKVLIGCGIGCGTLILVLLVAGAAGTAWLFSSGDQIATDAILSDDSLGVIRLHELADDPGTQELLNRALLRFNEINREQQRESLPPSLRWINDFQGNQGNPAQGLKIWIPKEMTITYEAAADGEGMDYIVAANPRAMVRFFRTMLGLVGEDGVKEEYQGHPVYRLDEGADTALAFVGSTVLYASSRDALLRAIDRVAADETEPREPSASGSIPDGDWDAEGVMGNQDGFIEALLGDEPGPTGHHPVTGDLDLGFGLDVVSADEIAGRTILDCGDPKAARVWLAHLEKRYVEMSRDMAEEGLELEAEVRAEGNRVVTELRLTGIETMIDKALSSFADVEEDE